MTTPWATCATRTTLGTGSTAPGWPPGPGSSWPPWTWCRAARTRHEARDLLDEALALGLAAHSTGCVTLCLVAFARYAVMEGDAERAALLAGAAEGLRHRVGLRAWPMLRHEEDDLVAQIRRALGAGRFDQVYAAGARLSQRDAVTAVRDWAGPGHAAAPSRPGTSSRS
jgi:hypothetical protein